MKNFNYLILLLFIGNSFMVTAQSTKQKKADRFFNDLAYIEAVDVYKELVDKNYNSEYNKQKLGDSYSKLRMPENAVVYYADVVNQENVSPEYYFKYAQALRGVKRYDESREWLQKYQASGGNTEEVKELLSGNISDFEIKESYVLKNVDYNSPNSDFGAFEKDGTIYFVSARDGGMSKRNKTYSWNGEPYLDVYQLNGETVSSVNGEVNTVLHDGPVSISEDATYMYFNRNNFLNNKEGKRDKKHINNLKIYRATNVNGQWTNVVELPFNNNAYSVGHPSLSKDGKTLYFYSDMPNGFGGTDIYKVDILEDGSYGSPLNLGEKINTSQDEVFPFVTQNNVLFFSSNGHLGLGLMDIFKVDLAQNKAKVENLGAPVNTNMDDFGYFQSSGDNTGYFSSNREGGQGSDDIYGFNLLMPLTLKGQVTDNVNKKPIPNATIQLFDENDRQIAFLETDQDGNYKTEINRDTRYPVEAKHIKYEVKNATVSSYNTGMDLELVFDLELDPIRDVEYLAEIENIYFDFDKSNIRKDAATELDKLVNLLVNEYPELIIEIGSHTDFRGSDQYNEDLAKRRAQATNDYLISKGVSPERIMEYKGYGEKAPAVECRSCDEVQHQLNRRSMFKVVKM